MKFNESFLERCLKSSVFHIIKISRHSAVRMPESVFGIFLDGFAG